MNRRAAALRAEFNALNAKTNGDYIDDLTDEEFERLGELEELLDFEELSDDE